MHESTMSAQARLGQEKDLQRQKQSETSQDEVAEENLHLRK